MSSLPDIDTLFKKIDTDQSGRIDINEFCDFMIEYYHVKPEDAGTIKMIISIFKLCDTKTLFHRKDDHIDRKEFNRIYACIQPYDPAKTVKNQIGTFLFKAIDSNNSGNISSREMAKFTKALRIQKDNNAKFMMELDTNRDGRVDLGEFLAWFNEF